MEDVQLKNDLKFLLSFVPSRSAEGVTKGLSPMFYETGSYSGDLALAVRVEEIMKRYGIESPTIDNDEDFDEGAPHDCQ